MSHLPSWERLGMTHEEYRLREGRVIDRAVEIVKSVGVAPLDAVKRAAQELGFAL